MSPTIKDVAAAAQTSIKTVSRVVNNEPGVAPETRSRVRQVIDELGYVPNISARRLKSGRAETFALVLPRVELPYAMRLLSCVLREARSQGYSVQVIESDLELDKEKDVIERAIRLRQIDGLIIAPPLLDCTELLADLNERRFPICDDHPQQPGACQLLGRSDRPGRYCGGERATCSAWGTSGSLISPADRTTVSAASDWQVSARKWSRRAYRTQEQLILEGDTTFESGYRIAQTLVGLVILPTAVLAGNDEMAVGVINYLSTNGLRRAAGNLGDGLR